MKRGKRISVGVGLVLLVLALILYGKGGGGSMEVLSALPNSEIPQAIHLWLVTNEADPGFAAFYAEGTLYLAVKLGQRPTGGYSVLLGDVELSEPVTVRVEEKSPKPWAIVTQVITFPRTVVEVSCPRQPQSVIFFSKSNSVLAKVAVHNLETETGGE